ncbi:MAG: nucleotide exchange factor GrpE [Candidatus Paceibacterota bacterium]|jgi:molecular chaperone GrpE
MPKKQHNEDGETEKEFHEHDDAIIADEIVAEEHMTDAIKKLREKLKTAEAEKLEYLTGWQRAKADMINAKKRDDAEKAEFIKFANERLIESLLPVMESFDMAMGNKEVWEKVEKNWRVGVEYIYSQLNKVLSESGVEEVNPMNKPFDHNVHEAVSYEPVTDENLDNVVIGVVQKGYYLNGKLLKPAKVKVGEYKK